MPCLTVLREQDFELQLSTFIWEWVPEYYSVLGIPECDGVEESFRILVGEFQVPVLPGIERVVNPGLLTGPARHQKSLFGGEGNDSAEIECCGAGNLRGSPRLSSVDCADIGSVCAAGPRDLARDRTYPTQAFGRVGDLNARLGLCAGSSNQENGKQEAHGR